MNHHCATCQNNLNPGDNHCNKCGMKFDNPVPVATVMSPKIIREGMSKPIKFLIKCAAIFMVVFVILTVCMVWFASTPAGKAAAAIQARNDALHQQQLAKQAALNKANQTAKATHQANLQAHESRRQAQHAAAKNTQSQNVITDTTAVSADDPSPELRLATLQNNGPIDHSDLLVRQFAGQLDALEAKCKDPQGERHKRQGIANMVVQVHNDLEAKGIDDSYLSILTNVNAGIPPRVSVGTSLPELFATYYELRIPH